MLKDLHKPGRRFFEYVEDDRVTPKIDCISCGRRPKIGRHLGGWICGDDERFEKCNPHHCNEFDWEMEYKLWIPRVDYSVLKPFIGEKEFNVQ